MFIAGIKQSGRLLSIYTNNQHLNLHVIARFRDYIYVQVSEHMYASGQPWGHIVSIKI